MAITEKQTEISPCLIYPVVPNLFLLGAETSRLKKYGINLSIKIEMNLSGFMSVTNQFDLHLK